MRMIRGNHDHIVQTLSFRKILLHINHFVVARVSFDWIRPVRRVFESSLWITSQCSCHHAARAIEVNRFLMWMRKEGTTTAADEPNIECSWR